MKLLSSVLWSAGLLASVQSAPLKELAVLKASEDNPVMLSVEYCDWTVSESDNMSEELWSGRTRCYCVSQSGTDYGCEIPAPVIQFEAGTTAVIDVTNRMTGMSSQEIEAAGIQANNLRGVDVTNLHTHGLHVSPDEDDVLLTLEPSGGHRRYNYTIPADHYFGTHWYHAHHHGSTAIQVTGGLLGPLEVIGDEMGQLRHFPSSWMVLSEFFAVSSKDCGNCDDQNFTQWVSSNGRGAFAALSTCVLWCSLDSRERDASGLGYEFESRTNQEYFLVNGQLSPTVSVLRKSYHWLRLVNGMAQYFAQLKFPEECEAFLAGNDGVFFEEYRDLDMFPFDHSTVLNPGTRADVFIKCQKHGVYPVYFQSGTVEFTDAGAMPPDGTVAFFIEVLKKKGCIVRCQ